MTQPSTMATMTEHIPAAESECSCTNPAPPPQKASKKERKKSSERVLQTALAKANKKIETLEARIDKYKADIANLKEDIKTVKRSHGRLSRIPKA